MILVKPGVLFIAIAPAGFAILAALQHVSVGNEQDITITSACDGAHSGPDDPHHRGEAYDIRCHDVHDPAMLLQAIQLELGTTQFYSFIEDDGTPNQHIHIQLRKGVEYAE